MEESIMLRHEDEKHDGDKVKFSMVVVKSFQNDALGRQIMEALLIRKQPADTLINNKREFRQPCDVNLEVERKRWTPNKNAKRLKRKVEKGAEVVLEAENQGSSQNQIEQNSDKEKLEGSSGLERLPGMTPVLGESGRISNGQNFQLENAKSMLADIQPCIS